MILSIHSGKQIARGAHRCPSPERGYPASTGGSGLCPCESAAHGSRAGVEAEILSQPAPSRPGVVAALRCSWTQPLWVALRPGEALSACPPLAGVYEDSEAWQR